jgi:hypothetical protein
MPGDEPRSFSGEICISLLDAKGFYEMDQVTDTTDGYGSLLYTYIVKRVNDVAPPTALGTEEWNARVGSCWRLMSGARWRHEVKVRAVCER